MHEIAQIQNLLQDVTSIVVVTHERPDGDAIGSLIATTLILNHKGIRAVGVLASGVPRRFRFLPGSDQVQQTFPKRCDLLIAVDVSAMDRIGYNYKSLPREVDINIDHHPTNTFYGKVNFVQENAAATTEILYDLATPLGWVIDIDIAINLLTGLVTDTIGFRTTNVTPKVLQTTAKLIELGAPLAKVYELALNTRSFDAARYWGRGLAQLEREDGLIWASLTAADREQVGYPGLDDADLINLLTTIEGAQVTIIFVEQPGNRVKVSWRSRSGIDVAKLATSFGGGGHTQAAGAMVTGTLTEVQSKVLSETQALIRTVPEKTE
jgi:phosphoesterase RecJ-like protein